MSNGSSGPSSASEPDRTAEPYNATIVHWRDVTGERAIFRVRPDRGPAPAFEPGQYALLALPREHPPVEPADARKYPRGDPRWKKLWRRELSIASSAAERGHLEFFAVRIDEGKLTPRLWRAREGGRVWLDERVRGDFTLRPVPRGANIVLVATGTGVAPYVSMLRTYRGSGRWGKLALVHGARFAADLGYQQEIERIAAEDPSVRYLPICSREPEGSAWTGARGHVQDLLEARRFEALAGFPLEAGAAHAYLCGHPRMIEDCGRLLRARGFTPHRGREPGNLHTERFWS